MFRRIALLAVGIVFATGLVASPAQAAEVASATGVVVTSAQAGGVTSAVTAPARTNWIVGTVNNNYECHPGTGWCYQTNPPYNPTFRRDCRWNYRIPAFTGGMWYTGCNYWNPEVH